ncbi:unnamed protein product [Phytomonas sp. EM1]|nr:unnamed protein product [Phytomonas sp. EM1]|eukprot:CCW65416.1 unnamed protein product [Phytomonas sp. isolate EM1]
MFAYTLLACDLFIVAETLVRMFFNSIVIAFELFESVDVLKSLNMIIDYFCSFRIASFPPLAYC